MVQDPCDCSRWVVVGAVEDGGSGPDYAVLVAGREDEAGVEAVGGEGGDAYRVVVVECLLKEVEEGLCGSETSGLLFGVAGGEYLLESFPTEGLKEREKGRVAECFGGIESPDVGVLFGEELP